jgi:hypothetical protein
MSNPNKVAKLKAISFATLYGFISIAATIFTKILVTSFGFNFTSILVLLEKMLIITFIFMTSDSKTLKDGVNLASKTYLLSAVSLLNALVSITSLEGVNF